MTDNEPTQLINTRQTKSYGTLPTSVPPAIKAPQWRLAPQTRAIAKYGWSHKGYSAVFLCLCMVIVWSFSLRTNHDSPRVTPSLPPARDRPEHDPEYLWLIEHDEDAHDERLATLKSLYAVDKFLTNKTEGM